LRSGCWRRSRSHVKKKKLHFLVIQQIRVYGEERKEMGLALNRVFGHHHLRNLLWHEKIPHLGVFFLQFERCIW
jgi:hypothetical protein